MKLIIGALFVIAGSLIIRYRYRIYAIVGDWGWAEKYLGGGGTITAISLFGALLFAAGFAYPFGAFDFSDANLVPDIGTNK